MAQLLFFDADHRYELDGEVLPSVSEIIRFISREVYGNVAQYTLDHAASRGTRTHKACENLDKFGETEADEEIISRVRAYMQFLEDKKPKWTAIEKPMHAVSSGYAGTIDRIGVLGGETWLIDIKAQEQIKKPYVSAQVNGYKLMAEENGLKIDRLGCLQVMNSGKYRLHDIEFDPTVFNACLCLHNTLKPKRKRGKTEVE